MCTTFENNFIMSFKTKCVILLLFIALNSKFCYMMPASCPNVQINNNNYVRHEILDSTTYRVYPHALSLKEITGSEIYRCKHILEADPPYAGFPNISTSENCSLCEIQNCYRDDCISLKSFKEFINLELSSAFMDLIGNITKGVERIREWMDCDETSITLVPNTQSKEKDYTSKEKDYRIAKDSVNYLKKLEQKYSEIN